MWRFAATAGKAVAQVAVYVRPQVAGPTVGAEARAAAWAGVDARRYFWSSNGGNKGDDEDGKDDAAAAASSGAGSAQTSDNVRWLHHASALPASSTLCTTQGGESSGDQLVGKDGKPGAGDISRMGVGECAIPRHSVHLRFAVSRRPTRTVLPQGRKHPSHLMWLHCPSVGPFSPGSSRT